MAEMTAIITGGSQGIGEDLADRLLEKDYTVISIARKSCRESQAVGYHRPCAIASRLGPDTIAGVPASDERTAFWPRTF
jgi:NAD(P)-dependent dehydrogenase (short-subunit alcohol dehydrogenase family)